MKLTKTISVYDTLVLLEQRVCSHKSCNFSFYVTKDSDQNHCSLMCEADDAPARAKARRKSRLKERRDDVP